MTTVTETTLTSLGLRAAELCTILGRGETRVFPKGAIIVKAGDQSDFLYIILEGRVKACVVDPAGKEAVLSTHGAGEYFGGMWFDGQLLPASIMTVEPSRFLVIPKSDLKAYLSENHLFPEATFEKTERGVEGPSRELSEALQQKAAISEILRVISDSPTDVQSVLDAVSENAARLCDVTNAEIFQVEGDELRLVANRGLYRIRPIGFSIKISRQIVIGRAVVDRTPVYVLDLQAAGAEFPTAIPYAKQFGQRTVLAAPLLREGVALGAILITRLEVRPFTDKQMTLLKTFADQAAIAIEHVRLFNEIEEKSRTVEEQAKELAEWNAMLETRVAKQVAQIERLSKLELELSLAGEIQKSMLPRSFPRLQGYDLGARMIPAKIVGGDFFDFIPLGRDSLGIAIGDVSDKGVPAALFMAMVRSLLRAEAHPGRSPKNVLREVNRHLMDMNDKEMFVTILFGILNCITHQFRYARAGHEAPILFDRQGSMKRLPKSNGQALGIFDTITLDEQTVQVSSGNMILLYSDGLTDATNRHNETFGFDRLGRTLINLGQRSAQMVCDALINAVTDHQAGISQEDDMTVVVLQAV
jgi:serine phosphatase RsbU (regulator of sigma subunit)/CRP-like cAMP-binding protein